MIRRLEEIFDARVKGTVGKRKGRLVIEFKGMKDLNRIFGIIAGEGDPAHGEASTGSPEPGG